MVFEERVYSKMSETLPEFLYRLLCKHIPDGPSELYQYEDVAEAMAEDIRNEHGGNLEASRLSLMNDPQFLAESHKLELEEQIAVLKEKLSKVENNPKTTEEKSADPDSDREKHMFKLADAFYQNLLRNGDYTYGGWGQDGKRPFGNSAVLDDVLKIIGASRESQDRYGADFSGEQKEYAANLYADLGDFLKKQWGLHRGDQEDEKRLKELQDLHEAELCECSAYMECDTAFLFRLIQEARKALEEEKDNNRYEENPCYQGEGNEDE